LTPCCPTDRRSAPGPSRSWRSPMSAARCPTTYCSKVRANDLPTQHEGCEMSAIGPGDYVECVALNCGCEDARPAEVALFLSEGATFHVTRVGMSGDGKESVEIADWPDT